MNLIFPNKFTNFNILTLLLLSILFVISCSSVKKVEEKENAKSISIDTVSKLSDFNYIKLKKEIKNYEFKGDLEISMNEDEYSGVFRGISYKDSILLVDFYGPFGIDVGRVEITKENLKIINKWHRKYMDINLDSATVQVVTPLELANKILLASSLIDSLKFIDNIDVMSIDTSINKIKVKYNINKNNKSVTNYFVSYDSLQVNLEYLNFIDYQNEKVPNSLNLSFSDQKIKMKLYDLEYFNYETNKNVNTFNVKKFKKVTNFNKLFN